MNLTFELKASRVAIAAAMILLPGAVALAESDSEESRAATSSAYQDDALEEIVVSGTQDDNSRSLDLSYEETLRTEYFTDLRRVMELRDQSTWLKSLPVGIEGKAGFSWGYEPASEFHEREDWVSPRQQWGDERPATVLRFEF